MTRNYDTTGHKPYTRVTAVSINYSSAGVPSIEYTEQLAVVDGNGVVQHLNAASSRHVLDLGQITEPVQVVHPATGQPIPGMTATQQGVMLGILAFVRADQVRRDGPAVVEPAPAEPAGE